MPTWKELLYDVEFKKNYFVRLKYYIQQQRITFPNRVFPDATEIFTAFQLTPYDKVRVVIIGQDPYHTPNTAHGLAFSSKGIIIPPSLSIIFAELKNDLYPGGDEKMFKSPNLSGWAHQGVLLLNMILTVRQAEPLVHEKMGWLEFTAAAIKALQSHPKPIAFVLWGKKAQAVKPLITNPAHLVLEAPHPASELYKHGAGFFECKHFSKVNAFLKETDPDSKPINWLVTDAAL